MSDIPESGSLGRVSRRGLLLGAAGAAVVLGGGAGAADYEIGRHPTWRTRVFGCGDTPSIPHSTYVVTAGSFPSKAMHADVPWVVAMPATAAGASADARDRVPLVIVLPGADAAASALTDAIGLPGWATATGLDHLAFACPGGGGQTYYHPRADGTDSFTWVTEEFVPMIEQRFGVGGRRGRRAAYGYSMGGFGALLIAAHRPDLVNAVAASSPAGVPVVPSSRHRSSGHIRLGRRLAALGPVAAPTKARRDADTDRLR